jgi:predicted RNase H-like HicB family nuclease
MRFKGTVVIQYEDDCKSYVATCLENDVASDGPTINEAIANLREALELYYEDGQEIPAYHAPLVTTVELAV